MTTNVIKMNIQQKFDSKHRIFLCINQGLRACGGCLALKDDEGF